MKSNRKPSPILSVICYSALSSLLVTGAHATTFTWDGGGNDNLWKTPANWNSDTAPDSDGTAALSFAGATRTNTLNDFDANTLFSGMTFANATASGLAGFTLAGNRVVLGGNITTVQSTSGSLNDTIALNLLLNASRTVTVNTAHNLTISGVIGETNGIQNLTKTGSGELTLSATNTYSGKTTLSGGRVYFTWLKNIGEGPSSFGSPTTSDTGTIDFSSRLTYTGGSTTSDRIFNITANGPTFEVASGSTTLTLNGGFRGANMSVFLRGAGAIVANGPLMLGNVGISRTDGGILYLNNPTNGFTGDLTVLDGTISVASLADAGITSPIGSGMRIALGQGNGTTGRFRYTGTTDAFCNRTILITSQTNNLSNGGIIENATPDKTLTLSGTVSSAITNLMPKLQLTGVGNGVLSGVITGAMQVVINGTGTWTLAGANVYTGTTTVTYGTLLVNGSTAAGCPISVSANGTLGGTGTVYGAVTLATGAKLVPGANGIGTLTVANASATAMTLNSATITSEVSSVSGICDSLAVTGTLVLNGANTLVLSFPAVTAPNGTYTLLTYGAKTGSGSLNLDRTYPNATLTVGSTNAVLTISGNGSTASSLTWVGDNTANAWNTTAPNWTPMNYADGTRVIIDDTGSASPALVINPSPIAPESITVNTSNKTYTLTGNGITGACSLLKTGPALFTVNTTNTYTRATMVNAGTLQLNGALSNSTLTVAVGATFSQAPTGRIDGAMVAITNMGTMTLNGTNTYGGVTVVGVSTGTPNITLYANTPYALGSTEQGTIVYGGNASTESRLMIGNNVTITGETLTLMPASGYRAGLRFNSGGTGTWAGNIVLANVGGPAYIGNDSTGTLVIGGSDTNTISGSSGNLSFRGGGTVIVNSRLNLGSMGINRDDPGTLILNATNNVLGSINVAQGTLKLGASDVLPATISLSLGKNSAINNLAFFDLNGCSQCIANFTELHASGTTGTQKIISATPATLIVSNTTANTFGTEGSAIEGHVSLVKQGSGSFTLTGTNTTSGSFIVSNGTLVVSATGTLGNSTNIVVASGTLTLQNGNSITNTATVHIANGGAAKINLSGVNETVGQLFFGDKQKRAGTYGSTDSGAEIINTEHFTGSGILTVLLGSGGTALILR